VIELEAGLARISKAKASIRSYSLEAGHFNGVEGSANEANQNGHEFEKSNVQPFTM
jgi:hypothetical protein